MKFTEPTKIEHKWTLREWSDSGYHYTKKGIFLKFRNGDRKDEEIPMSSSAKEEFGNWWYVGDTCTETGKLVVVISQNEVDVYDNYHY